MDILMVILFLIILIIVAVWVYIAQQGDAEFVLLMEQRTPWVVDEVGGNSVTFSTRIPFMNQGSQDGTIMDAFPRTLLPCEQYDGVEVYSYLTNEAMYRTDGYWESVIIPKKTGGTIRVIVKLEAKSGSITAALVDMVDMPIDIVYQVVARSDWYLTKQRLIFIAEEARATVEAE